MANVLVFVELRGGVPTAPSRFAVAEARRVANELGATVYALMAVDQGAPSAIEGLGESLGLAGADRVLCCPDPALRGPPVDALLGPLLFSVVERLKPALTLLPAGAIGMELGPPLAIRTGAAYRPRAALEMARGRGARGEAHLVLRHHRAAGGQRVFELPEDGPPVVATLAAGLVGAALGTPAAEVEMLSPLAASPPRFTERASEPDPDAEAELASTLVIAPEHKASAALQAAVPPGTVVADADKLSAATLAGACPARLLVVGRTQGAPRVAPDARVAFVGEKGNKKGSDNGITHIDVVLRASAGGAVTALAAAFKRSAHAGGAK